MSIIGFPDPVNEKAARVVAAGVCASAVLVLATGWQWLVPFMAVGFLLRVLSGPRFSPLGLLATKVVAPRLGEPVLVSGPPKRFAQGIGLAVTTVASLLGPALGLAPAASVLIGVLVLFAFLESVLGFCAGCWLYGQLIRAGVVRQDSCTSCADIWAPRQA
ncbi:DUF4395 domain-containing protein [Tessaracoccus sp. Y36]|uniref:DUF4395 domain-containing protein n=1 Tax=unclassified Tessaracoccus TaxID=2635419 RepID=UPI00096E950C|nr:MULTISPECIES: DUF4395 domain-containing protein [unclassified Tessaracoccus]MBB1510759.1 DUF4395 domain-containing protein [Tessaracoccus sp. MC1756]MCG6568387.1 DUF4395 domain-containing protein [Tessaracoccus sp. ZS01]OMG52793.1 MFS transporter permease [Tessaracoccus sp. ZS01]